MNFRFLSNPRVILYFWIGLIPVAIFLAVMLLLWLPQSITRSHVAQFERRKLELQLEATENEIKGDLARYLEIVKRFPWIIEGASGAKFLTRLSEVTGGQRLRILAIGALERSKAGQIERVGRNIELNGTFGDLVQLVERIQHNRGMMQGLKLEQSDLRGRSAGGGNLDAKFKMASIELSPEIREKLRALLAAKPKEATGDAKEVAPTIEAAAPSGDLGFKLAQGRDPFRAPLTQLGGARETAASSLFPKVTFSGIVGLPGGKAAIINNEMVPEGGRIGEITVERITDREVLLKSGPESRRLMIPAFASRNSGKEQQK